MSSFLDKFLFLIKKINIKKSFNIGSKSFPVIIFLLIIKTCLRIKKLSILVILLTSSDFKIKVRDLQKKMQHVENELDITLEKLTQTTTKLDEKEKAYAVAEGEIQALKRKIALLEDELER